MEIGRCTQCGRPFTSGEVTGVGILRTRPAREGGPRVDFTCPRCDLVLRLVPHGQGRYALPGAPLPPVVPPSARAPPWVGKRDRSPPGAPGADDTEPTASERVEIPIPDPPPKGPPGPPPPPPPPDDTSEGFTVAEALEVLGIAPTAGREEIDRAYRERSRTCHPDKVAHLDPEFQELAERKFRQLKQAYELLVS